MDWLVKLLYFSFLAYSVSGQTWDDPFVNQPANEHVTVIPGVDINILIDEEQEKLTIGILEYIGVVGDINIKSNNGEHDLLGLVAQCDGVDKCLLIANNKMDFESPETLISYRVQVTIKQTFKEIIIKIVNIDDNPTFMQLDGIKGCEIEERFSTETNEFQTDCKYTINDADGKLAATKFKVVAEDDEHNYAAIFEFRLDNSNIPENEKSAKVSLYVKEGAELKYSRRSLYIFTLRISEATPSESDFRALIAIIDIPNSPPVWTQIMSMYQFPEHEPQTFQIRAEDGDITIEADIGYKIDGLDSMWADVIKLDSSSGDLSVGDIDRDVDYFNDKSDISFNVIAYETEAPDQWKTDPYKITFIIVDIDDQVPEITLGGGADPDPTLFRICESKSGGVPNLQLEINDKDLGENARYRVTLEENDFSKAFKIIPDNGYQKLPFLLNIDNGNLLDYETASWQSFNFELQSSGVNGDKADSKQIKFELINWNDELPTFKENGYTAAIDETILAGELVVKVEATDGDGFEITYSLPVGMGSILEITQDGEIKTKVNNVFDFERQETLLVYVTATDTFPGDEEGCNVLGNPAPANSATVTITVNINDINDETPVLTAIVSNQITIEENAADGTQVDLGTNVIEGTDADKDADLEFEIVWDESRATKFGSQLSLADFDAHVRDFLVVATDTTTVVGKAIPIFTTKEKYPENSGNSPDYEKFHMVVLKLKVTDKDQTLAGVDNFAKADISIYIGDVNDNSPIFVATSIVPRKVSENAVDGIPLGTVLAIDEDGSPEFNKVTYTLEPQPGTPPDRVKINPDTGDLSVDNADPPATNIDCDEYQVAALTYLVHASDPDGNENNAELVIEIVDVNDVSPVLSDMAPIDIPEEQDIGVEIPTAGVSATDGDRDQPHNVVRYSISNLEAAAYFEIAKDPSTGKGVLTIKSKIDRENIPANPIVVSILAMDNDGFVGLTDTKSISITITDINDNSPIIQTTTLPATENHGPTNANIGVIEIVDNDVSGHANSQITLEILSVTLNEVVLDGFFDVSDPVQTGQTSRSTLTALKSLVGYSGVVDIVLKASDKGDQTEGSEPHELTLKLIVDRYNFQAPVITFPSEDRYYLIVSEVNFPVMEVTDDELQAFEGNDNQGGKYQVELKLLDPASTETNEIDHQYFKFSTGSSTAVAPAKIYIKAAPVVNQFYEMKIKATNKDGEPPTKVEKTVQFMFRDRDEQPSFQIPEKDFSIWENDPDAMVDSSGTSGLPLATYGDADNPLPVFYHLQDPVAMPFKIVTNDDDKKYYGLAVDKERFENGLDREIENGESYEVKIIAARSNIPPSTADEKSILTVKMNIMDRNDNDPVFTQEMYYGALINTYSHGQEIITVQATDLDATDSQTYKISAYTGHGDASNVENPFLIDLTSGKITLNFRVTSDMQGYIDLDLLVTDVLEGGGNTDQANAQIYIVSDLHRVDFKFLNDINEVDLLQQQILDILKEVFGYECIYEKSNMDTEDEQPIAVFSVHFIDIDKHEPILKQEIIDKASVVTVISSLTGKFNSIGLALKSFVDTFIIPEDLSEYYKTWLIGVAAVMGVMIVFIIIAFTFKYLGMRKQIGRLTGRKFASMDSGLNRIAAPNTNIHTHDGSNPVYIQEHKEKVEMPDNVSISSGDSELYGVENNPVFANNMEKY